MKRIFLSIFILLISGVFLYFYFIELPKFAILNGYAAKKACSCHFIAQRSLDSVKNNDLAGSPLNMAHLKINAEDKSVSSTVFGMGKRVAKYSPGYGCTLINGKDDRQDYSAPIRSISNDTLPWPRGNAHAAIKTKGIDIDKISEAIEYAFDEPGQNLKKTRAIVIIQNDSLVAEEYAEGFNADTEILGWSMTKSICNILIGILVKQGKLDVYKNSLFPEWDDQRKEITLNNLLRMESGLEWEEIYSEIADATRMLFKEENMGDYALNSQLEFDPGAVFEYSSGTTNLLSVLIRSCFKTQKEYIDFPYNSLFNKLGLDSLTLEMDESGHYVLSSYCFATPREWAKLGLLYLNKGNWYGDEIFATDWYDYSIRPGNSSSDGSYGAHIWLNTGHNDLEDAPESVFRFSGYEGQYVYIIPSHNAVVVRMGLSEGPYFDMNGVIQKILSGLEPIPA